MKHQEDMELLPNLNFFGKMRRCLKFYKEFYLRKASKTRLIESKLQRRLNEGMRHSVPTLLMLNYKTPSARQLIDSMFLKNILSKGNGFGAR